MDATHAYYKHLQKNTHNAFLKNERVKILKKHPNDDGYTIYVPSINRERETIAERLDFICTTNNYKCFMCCENKNVENEKSFFIRYRDKVYYGCASCAQRRYNIILPQNYHLRIDNLYWEINENTYHDKTIYYKIVLDILSQISYICNICNEKKLIFDGINIETNVNICSQCNGN